MGVVWCGVKMVLWKLLILGLSWSLKCLSSADAETTRSNDPIPSLDFGPLVWGVKEGGSDGGC